MPNKKMVEVNKCHLYIVCICGITWKLPFGRGKGLFEFNFRCDGKKGCNRHISVGVKDNRITNIIGADSWWLEEVANGRRY